MCVGHAEFDVRFAELVRALHAQAWDELDIAWKAFAGDLADHLAYEEREIFDDYAQEAATHQEAAARLRADHHELRDLLGRLGSEIESRRIETASVDALVDMLRAHAQREEATIYPWLERRRGRSRH